MLASTRNWIFVYGCRKMASTRSLLYLVQAGLMDIPVLFLSRYIIANKRDYDVCLQKVTEQGDWDNWVLLVVTMFSISDDSRASCRVMLLMSMP